MFKYILLAGAVILAIYGVTVPSGTHYHVGWDEKRGLHLVQHHE